MSQSSDRYFLFAGFEYYPSGGMNDYQTSCETFKGAKEVYAQGHPKLGGWNWGHIAQIVDGELVMVEALP